MTESWYCTFRRIIKLWIRELSMSAVVPLIALTVLDPAEAPPLFIVKTSRQDRAPPPTPVLASNLADSPVKWFICNPRRHVGNHAPRGAPSLPPASDSMSPPLSLPIVPRKYLVCDQRRLSLERSGPWSEQPLAQLGRPSARCRALRLAST